MKATVGNSKKKIIILGDEFSKSCSQILYNWFDKTKYSIEGYVQPGADIGVISNGVFSTSISCGKKYSVVIMFKEHSIE